MTITILGAPRTKKNSQRIARRRDGRPFILQSAHAVGWEESAVIQIRAAWKRREPFTCPVSMRAVFYRDREVGDLGNFVSAACDALEHAGVVSNDRLIRSFDGSRLAIDRANPRVEIQIEPMGGQGE